MTALDDLNLEVAPIETAEDFRNAWSDPDLHWWAARRRRALIASGLTAASFEALHPRGHDGKFIEKWGLVRWFDKDSLSWRTGIVRDIDPDTGAITVSGTSAINQAPHLHVFNDPKELIARPRPKARMKLPDVFGGTQANWTKVGSQGGSNPGGTYEVTSGKAVMPGNSATQQSPDISQNNRMQVPLRFVADNGLVYKQGILEDEPTVTYTGAYDTVVVPALDGTPNRYDAVVRVGDSWYQVPATGRITQANGSPRPDLVVAPAVIFGDPGSDRRKTLIADTQGVIALNRRADITPDNVASVVQQAASPPPVDGDRFYVKASTPKKARNEALANAYYELLGTAVPEVSVGADGSTVASKLIGESVAFDPNNQEHRKAAQQGFVADAWLANWDAVGLNFDNMRVAPDGTVWRVDAGGALLYRAMGTPKGDKFGPDVTELSNLRNPGLNPTASAVYGSITNGQLQEQGEMLRGISPSAITSLAEQYELPEVGDTLIARRKSILDQLGIPDVAPQPPPTTTPAPTVYNPVEGITQPGQAPQTGVHNWNVWHDGLPTESINSDDLADAGMWQTAIIVKDDGLYRVNGGFLNNGTTADALATNLITDRTVPITIYSGQGGDSLLANVGMGSPELTDIVDEGKVNWNLAVAEIVADSAKFDNPNDIFNDMGWKDQYPYYLQPRAALVYGIDGIRSDINSGRMPGSGPIYNSQNGKMYEVVGFSTVAQPQTIELRESGQSVTVTLTDTGLNNAGIWYTPQNETAVGAFRSRLQDAPAAPVSGLEKPNLAVAEAEVDAPTGDKTLSDDSPFVSEADVPPPTTALLTQKVDKVPDSGASTAEKTTAYTEYDLALSALHNGQTPPPTPTLDKLAALPPADPTPDSAAIGVVPHHVADAEAQAKIAAEPTVSAQIDDDTPFLKSLAPGSPIFASDLKNKLPEELEAMLVGKNIVVLDQEHFTNPESDQRITHPYSGLMKVTGVKNFHNTLYVSGQLGNGKTDTIYVSPTSNLVFTPVEAEPVNMPITMKLDGRIMSGKREIGKWYAPYASIPDVPGTPAAAFAGEPYYYRVVLNGDESVTGRPLVLQGYSKNDLRDMTFKLVNPIAPPPKKPKKPAAQLTEADIAKLKTAYAEQFTPMVTAQVSESFKGTTATPVPGQSPLADGTQPVVGQWVYAPKDNTWWQVQQTDPKLTGKEPGTNLRVRRQVTQPDGTTKTVESFRGRSTMYAVSGKGAYPTMYLPTNIVTLGDGKKAGPGMEVWSGGAGTGGRIMEIKGGKVKVLQPQGGVSWFEPSALQMASPSAPGAQVAITEADVQSLIDAEVAKTVDQMVADAVAHDLAVGQMGKKKPPHLYPGPDGALVKQDIALTQARLAKGLPVLADGYAPVVGQVVRHKDGTQYIVVEVKPDYASAQNSVKVMKPGGSIYDAQWRAMSTLVIDHQAMLTDKNGEPLPKFKSIAGGPATLQELPDGSVIWRRNQTQNTTWDPINKKYRQKTFSTYYAVTPDGRALSLANGKSFTPAAMSQQWPQMTRVAVYDQALGSKQLTLSVDDDKYAPKVQSFVVHDPGTDPTALLAGQHIPAAPVPIPAPAPQPLSTTSISVGDVVTLPSGATGTVKQMTGTFVVVESPDGEQLTLGIEQVAPATTSKQAWTLPDGGQIVDGQQIQVHLTGPPATVVGFLPQPNAQVELQMPDGQLLWVPAANPVFQGLSPAPAGLAPIQPPKISLSDLRTVTVGDMIQINDQPDMKVIDITTDGKIVAEYPQSSGIGGQTGTFDISQAKFGSKGATVVGPVPGTTPPAPAPGAVTTEEVTGPLPPFTGEVGGELVHPAPVTQQGIPAPKITGTGADLTSTGAATMAGTKSVMGAVNEVRDRVKSNALVGQQRWAVSYGLGDTDDVEDMLFHTQLVRDKQGGEKIELTFRLNNPAANAARERLMTKQSTTLGDWTGEVVDPKNLVIGDQVSLRESTENAEVLKPDPKGVPNAVVTSAPVLVGQHPTQGLPVYRVQVAFQNGESGYIDLVSGHPKQFRRYTWDPNKIRASNGVVGLNPDAAADGWSIVDTPGSDFAYPRAHANVALYPDGAKMAPDGGWFDVSGTGELLTRNVDGADVNFWTSGSRNTLDGQVSITVDPNDPDAQRKISEALEAVGITPDKQAPPTKDALARMALNKVYKQFNLTYERGTQSNATAEDPSQVLGLMDQAVGSYLGRPTTLHDISLAVDDEGQVQTLLSPEVAHAISQRNGVKFYRHDFITGDTERMFGVLAQSPGLLASNERFNSGLWLSGYSSTADHAYESANRVYTRAVKQNSAGPAGDWAVFIDADTFHRMTDHYWRDGDSMGERYPDNTEWLDMNGSIGSNEMMVKRQIDTDVFGAIMAPNQSAKDAIIKQLTDWGLPKAPNGQSWDEFIRVNSIQANTLKPLGFPHEIPLDQILTAAV